MADLAATSKIAKAAEAMKTLLAGSTTFQTMVGAASAAAAKAFIFIGSYTPEAAVARPFALVSAVAADKNRKIGTGAWVQSGEFKILIERDVTSTYQADEHQTDAEMEFRNLVGEITEEMMDLSCTAGYLVLRSLDITEGPYRYEPATGKSDTMGCWMTAAWGLE
jgi:hypothetical protein